MLLTISCLQATPQTVNAWEDQLRDLISTDEEAASWDDCYERLCEAAQNPIDLNSATREDLEQLGFLTPQQVEEICEYLYYYGPMKSLAELMMISSLDYYYRVLLLNFVYLKPEKPKGFPSWRTIMKYGKNELIAQATVPFYRREGDDEGYHGEPYRHFMRYQFSYSHYVKAGIVGAQDAGEPFFANKNHLGYDYYSAYVQIQRLGIIKSAIVGKYRVREGLGLIAGDASYMLSKSANATQAGRNTAELRTHSSRSTAHYLQGAAISLQPLPAITLTAYASYRPLDATLNDDGTAATILTSGYHRTTSELSKKNNTHQTTGGLSAHYNKDGLHIGLNGIATHLDRPLQPNTNTLYRRYYATGSRYLNMSADYGYRDHRLTIAGETAVDRDGHMATINTVGLNLNHTIAITALQRYYSYRYHSLHAMSFSDAGHVQNESGLYVGVTWTPSQQTSLSAYADYAYFPWARYQVSQSSHSSDHLLALTHRAGPCTWNLRYRLRLRQKDNDTKTALHDYSDHRMRLSLAYAASKSLTLRTQADADITTKSGTEHGIAVSETATYAHKNNAQMSMAVTYFNTDSFESRLYIYERGPLYTSTFRQYSGHGARAFLMMRKQWGSSLLITAKLGTTRYFDRKSIGTGLAKTDTSTLTDLDLQLCWRL